MKDDIVMKLLREVKSGTVSIEDAREALSGVDLSEETYEAAVDHGVFNDPEPGTIIRASISPSGESWLVIVFALWGILWTLYWAGTLSYGLFNHWDQQLLSFFNVLFFLSSSKPTLNLGACPRGCHIPKVLVQPFPSGFWLISNNNLYSVA